jgi:hypothetical protein
MPKGTLNSIMNNVLHGNSNVVHPNLVSYLLDLMSRNILKSTCDNLVHVNFSTNHFKPTTYLLNLMPKGILRPYFESHCKLFDADPQTLRSEFAHRIVQFPLSQSDSLDSLREPSTNQIHMSSYENLTYTNNFIKAQFFIYTWPHATATFSQNVILGFGTL